MIRWCKVHHQQLTVLAFFSPSRSRLLFPVTDLGEQKLPNTVWLHDKLSYRRPNREIFWKYFYIRLRIRHVYDEASDAHVVSRFWSPPDWKLIDSFAHNRLLIHPIVNRINFSFTRHKFVMNSTSNVNPKKLQETISIAHAQWMKEFQFKHRIDFQSYMRQSVRPRYSNRSSTTTISGEHNFFSPSSLLLVIAGQKLSISVISNDIQKQFFLIFLASLYEINWSN